jgi:hypothetical protein
MACNGRKKNDVQDGKIMKKAMKKKKKKKGI